LSFTVTVNEQVPVLLLASIAVQLTVVVPAANAEPEAGEQEIVAPAQLSEAVAEYVTTALQRPGSLFTEMLAGQVAVGFSLSYTVTVNEQVPVLLLASVAVQLTVVVPAANVEPEAGEQEIVAPAQLSEAKAV
jgi:formaldehyde-activating enzyme involved in methanogenesis